MGGMNSGRVADFMEQRPQVEDAVILDIPLLRAHDALVEGARGVLCWERSKATFQAENDVLVLDYTTKGMQVHQRIAWSRIPLEWNNGTYRLALHCSDCGRRGYKLYLSRKPRFLCRACQDLVYELQMLHPGGLPYRLMSSIKEGAKMTVRAQRKRHRKGSAGVGKRHDVLPFPRFFSAVPAPLPHPSPERRPRTAEQAVADMQKRVELMRRRSSIPPRPRAWWE